MTPGTRRAPRKDAQRNRERILEAAREVVAERGVAAKMEQVAARAGVGIGTLYRFVPTKDALFSTILGEQADRLADLAERALALPPGESAFHTWMAEAAAWQSSNKAFINVLAARDPDEPVPKLLSAKLRALLRDLVRRGQADGDLRDDVTSSDVLMVLLAVGRIGEGTEDTNPSYARRFLALQLDALAPGGAPLPGKALTERQLELTLDALAHSRRRT
ncbi:TetR/AcrR family transcriptional regulator [Conexibacter woesei]|uniref:TetR/AcrR family transcriptional regulator n=1 Tax=Conexibacter woesei TaxID=191495 RepID=UPI000402CFEC|nr:TetR/AcrR family transcriptional regulator [Conexibacter woesei]